MGNTTGNTMYKPCYYSDDEEEEETPTPDTGYTPLVLYNEGALLKEICWLEFHTFQRWRRQPQNECEWETYAWDQKYLSEEAPIVQEHANAAMAEDKYLRAYLNMEDWDQIRLEWIRIELEQKNRELGLLPNKVRKIN